MSYVIWLGGFYGVNFIRRVLYYLSIYVEAIRFYFRPLIFNLEFHFVKAV